VFVLLDAPEEPVPAVGASARGPQADGLDTAGVVLGPPPPSEPDGEAPPADRPSLAAPVGLSDLAAGWREAVLLKRRDEILRGAAALRRAPDGREQLLALLDDGDGRVRAFALRELGRRREPGLETVFEARLADESPYVRENAAWALAHLHGESR
jgi:HEAT repeats